MAFRRKWARETGEKRRKMWWGLLRIGKGPNRNWTKKNNKQHNSKSNKMDKQNMRNVQNYEKKE